MLGYVFFGFGLFFYVSLFFVNFSEPRMSGEAGMGYGLAIAALGLGFAICSLILTISVANKGGFDWVVGPRFFIIGAGWLCMAAATFACVAFKWEWHEGEFPQFLRWLSVSHGQVWIPLLMFVPYFFLLNAELRASVSPNMYKIPLMIGFAVSVLMSLGLLLGWFKISLQQQQAQMEDRQNSKKNYMTSILSIERLFRAIDEQFINKGMDFRPAVLKLQDALKTTPPEQFKNVRFTVTPIVNDWLKKH